MAIPYQDIPSPAFVLDERRLIRNLERMAHVQHEAGVSIILALKGFAMWRVFPFIARYLKGGTASSLHEARLIYEEMGRPAHTYAAAFMPDEVEAILSMSSHITFNSVAEYERYQHLLALYPGVSPALRVNPEYSDVKTDLYNPADSDSRLGTLAEQLQDGLPPGVEGLHFHVLCESTAGALETTLQHFEQKFGQHLSRLKWVNFGGGHLMTHQSYDLDRLIRVLRGFRERYPHLEVWLEPGSAVAWETGELVATVLDIVETRTKRTAIVDVSFTAHMPDTLEMPYRPKILGATDPVPGKSTYRIGGVSCLAGDFMEAYSFDKELKVGDRLVFLDMIHYTMVKTTTFNGVRHPHICIWTTDDRLEVVRSFSYEDFKSRLS